MAHRLTLNIEHEDGVVRVDLDDIGAFYAEEMGAYLAAVASAIVCDYGCSFVTKRDDGDRFAAICDGFIEAVTEDEPVLQ
jgi:hypothetical protein